MSPIIQYIEGKNIDREKWDHCIDTATNGLVYGYSYYLDTMAANWDALVMQDYEAVMPLTWKKKYGIHYLFQPFITAQLGVFGKNITAGMLQSFLEAIPGKFRYWDFYLNHENVFEPEGYSLYQRSNFVLDLHQPYEELYKNYRDNLKRNIDRATKAGCVVKKDFKAAEVVTLAKEQMRNFATVSEQDFRNAMRLYNNLHTKGKSITYGIFSKAGQLLASCIFFFSHRRAYYILVGNHPDGKTLGASHMLIDAFIKDHSGKNLLLDFEGSDIRNLAFFYSSFGATEEKYAAIKLNRLPWYIRWMK